MQGQDEEAIYEISLLLNLGPKYLIHRAQHLIELAEMTNYRSIHSRNLWQEREWNRTVFDLVNRIDDEVNKIIAEENHIEEMHETIVKEPLSIGEQQHLLEEMHIDKRWSERTIPIHVREQFPEVTLTDEEILDIILPEEIIYYEDNQLTNIEYIEMLKQRRS